MIIEHGDCRPITKIRTTLHWDHYSEPDGEWIIYRVGYKDWWRSLRRKRLPWRPPLGPPPQAICKAQARRAA